MSTLEQLHVSVMQILGSMHGAQKNRVPEEALISNGQLTTLLTTLYIYIYRDFLGVKIEFVYG